MKKEIICSPKAPAAIGPYSQAVKVNGLLFVSGQLGIDPAVGKLAGNDVESQCKQVFKNLNAILTEAGMTFSNVVKATVFLTDINDFAKVNAIYAEHFQAPFPARAAFAVKNLPGGGLVEIEVIAAE